MSFYIFFESYVSGIAEVSSLKNAPDLLNLLLSLLPFPSQVSPVRYLRHHRIVLWRATQGLRWADE